MKLANVKSKTTVDGQAIPPLPKRPLTSFNLFSMLERKFIFLQQTEQDPKREDSNANINGTNNIEPYGAVRPQRYAKLVLAPDWYVVGANRIKRQDHKNHGLISFTDLSKTLSDRWKNADDEVKTYCKKIAAGELEKYRKEQEEYKEKYGAQVFDSQKRTYKKRKSKLDDSSTASNKRGKSKEEGDEGESQGEITENSVQQIPNEVLIHQNYLNQQLPLNASGNISPLFGQNGFADALPNVTSYPYLNASNPYLSAQIANLCATGLLGTTPLPPIAVPHSVILNSMDHQNQVSYYIPTRGIVHDIHASTITLASNNTKRVSFNIPPVNESRHSTQNFGSAVTPPNFIRDDSLKFGLDFKTFTDSELASTELIRDDNSLKMVDFKALEGNDHFAVRNSEAEILLRDDSLKILDFTSFNGNNRFAVRNPEPDFDRYTSLGAFDGCDEPLPLGREVVSAFEY
eukprot:scaffold14537_cov45-Cyclotella_meneghiniana.AAC.2